MKKHSCGAILFTIYEKKIYIVLGMELGEWYPFKGTKEKNETNEEAALREIEEEMCGAVRLNRINLDCHYSTKRKYYHIGLAKIPPESVIQFFRNRKKILRQAIGGRPTSCLRSEHQGSFGATHSPDNYRFAHDLGEFNESGGGDNMDICDVYTPPQKKAPVRWRSPALASSYLEKSTIRMFPLDTILNYQFHEITRIPIRFYHDYLQSLQKKILSDQSISPYLSPQRAPFGHLNALRDDAIAAV